MEDNISWGRNASGSEGPKGPHRDYEMNLRRAEDWIKYTEPTLPPWVKVRIADSHGLKNCLLTFSFSPPFGAFKGACSNPIFLHQSRDQITKEVQATLEAYRKISEEFEISQKGITNEHLPVHDADMLGMQDGEDKVHEFFG